MAMLTKAAHVLRRLPSWSVALAAARPCAGRASLLAAQDIGRRLLTTGTNKVHGLFINYIDHGRPHLFARPSPNTTIDPMLDFLPDDEDWPRWWSVFDHSNGLLLCDMEEPDELCVCNPATRRWTVLPWPRQAPAASHPAAPEKTSSLEPPPSDDEDNDMKYLMESESPRTTLGLMRYLSGLPQHGLCAGVYLAFDPAVSPHYELLAIPAVPNNKQANGSAKGRRSSEKPPVNEDDDTLRLMELEWPPTPWRINMFSSRTGRWEERDFVRRGEPAGTVRDILVDPVEPTWMGPRQRYGVYYQGALYVHCRGFFVLRLSLSNGTYEVIKTPSYGENKRIVKPYLGRSEKGVYFGIIEESQLRVWILSESSEQRMEWILKHQHDLRHYGQHIGKHEHQMDAPWMIHDVPDMHHGDTHGATKTLSKERFEWDSDNDDFLMVNHDADVDAGEYIRYFDIIGFHPYKEVVFLNGTFGVVAYHLKNSKAQYLGNSRPRSYYHNHTNGIYEGFVYSPCMVGALDEGNNKQSSS